MSRRPALVTQADIARALRAVEQTGYRGVVVIGQDGSIRIEPAAPAGAPQPTAEIIPLDAARPRIRL